MTQTTLHPLRPRRIRGCPIDYYKAPPEIGGGVLVAIFKDPARNEGMTLHFPDWGAVHRFLDGLRKDVGDAA